MPFVIYDFKDTANPVFVTSSQIAGKAGIVKSALQYSIKEKLILLQAKNEYGREEHEVSLTKEHIDKYLKSICCADVPKFLIQSAEKIEKADIFQINEIHIHSSVPVNPRKNGWVSFMLGLEAIGFPSTNSIRTKPPVIASSKRAYTINYFPNSWIDHSVKGSVVGKWITSGPYKSTFIWKSAGLFYKNKMNFE